MQNSLVCNTPATPMQHVVTERSDAEKAIRRIKIIAQAGTYFIRGGLDASTLQKHLEYYAIGRYNSTYIYDEKLLKHDVHLAISRAEREWLQPSKESFAEMVKNWVVTDMRQFSLQTCYNELKLVTVPEKANCRQVISRLVVDGVLKKIGKKRGVYQTIDNDLNEIDWQDTEEELCPIWLPFDLGDIAVIPYGSIILIAGAPGSGKTATLLNIVMENMNQSEVHYFSSEIKGSTFKRRVAKFPYTSPDQWKVRFYDKGDNFEDHIKSNKGDLNIIDYLEVHNDFYLVGEYLHKIHENLGMGIAIIALQKNPGSATGRGGWHTLEKPELGIALDHGKAKVVKIREVNPEHENPIHKEYHYEIKDGCQFIKKMGWHYPMAT